MDPLLYYVLILADDALIIAQRLSEWAYKAPFLEEDIALSNISLDMFGRANMLLEYAAKIKGEKTDADELAFKRNEREFFNHQLVEQENGHFGITIARNFLHDVFNFLFYTQLANSKDETLAALAAKSLKEVKYHLRHSSNWLIRLGDGTDKSKTKIQEGLNTMWRFTGELFEMDEIDKKILSAGIGVDNSALKNDWDSLINKTLSKAKLKCPEDAYMATGGKKGLHTENLGFILAEMQYLQRAYPDAKW